MQRCVFTQLRFELNFGAQRSALKPRSRLRSRCGAIFTPVDVQPFQKSKMRGNGLVVDCQLVRITQITQQLHLAAIATRTLQQNIMTKTESIRMCKLSSPIIVIIFASACYLRRRSTSLVDHHLRLTRHLQRLGIANAFSAFQVLYTRSATVCASNVAWIGSVQISLRASDSREF
ncbi:hypothetical protein EW146_g8713 [Bondarzewia mesenterica]|uniref:Uncharacterized protein n=1 Tax=Bondarzewia mesenterica TaxID=1095465 RepID=A0A4S4LDU8_9AGAM|nr:hypothetical protein EW146_g8713 [Bondarzewia mesenterica]